MAEIAKYLATGWQFLRPNGHRYANLVANTDCNRTCGYCNVPHSYNRETEPTIEELRQTIDWLGSLGYPFLTYLGGEPLADSSQFITKEGVSFFEQTLKVVQYAHQKGMAVNVTSNGDFVNVDKIQLLKAAGLDTLTFSIHQTTSSSLEHLIDCGKLAAKNRIVPTLHMVFTRSNADRIIANATQVIQNGIIFGTNVVQEHGKAFSTKPPENKSNIPTLKQQQIVFRSLSRLKKRGFIRNNNRYLTDANDHYPNNWKCDPYHDSFIHVSQSKLDVCSEEPTTLSMSQVNTLSTDQWRQTKQTVIENCEGCYHHCFYEIENPDIAGDIPLLLIAALIHFGRADVAEKLGQLAVSS